MNLSTVKWAQWDKTQSRELLGLFICVCTALCTIVVHNIAQNRPDNFPSYHRDNQTLKQMSYQWVNYVCFDACFDVFIFFSFFYLYFVYDFYNK